MPATPEISVARPHELNELILMYNEEIVQDDATPHATPLSATEFAHWIAEHDGFTTLVARRGASLLGWMTLRPLDAGSAYRHTALMFLMVEIRSRRTGVGTALLAAAEPTQFHSITAFLPGAPTWRVEWLQRAGWRSCGAVCPWVGGQAELVVLEKLMAG